MALKIHRARQCDFNRVWAANATSAVDLSSLQEQGHAIWSIIDASAVSITSNVLEIQNTTLRITIPLSTTSTLYRLSMRTRLLQNAQTMIKTQLHGRTLAFGSSLPGTLNNEVVFGSSQSSLKAVQLPCVTNVADTFLDVDFVWHDEWIRWLVNGVMLFEEFMPYDKHQANRNAVIEFRVDAKLRVDWIELSSANASDEYCAPQYLTLSNCRPHEALTPRLGSIRGSLSVEEVDAFINQVATKYPLITRIEDLGKSVEGRPLRALCLGACEAQDKQNVPQILYTGMHHAREPLSMMNLIYTVDILTLDYLNGDLAALELLTSRQLWFIFIVNPDGYAHNTMARVWEHGKIGQRKSGASTCDQSPPDAGVDLNRNYDVCFARDRKGSSNEPCGDDYNGAKAFSEPETQAVRDLVERHTSDFSVALNYHSYGKYINLPFACQAKGEPSAPNKTIFVALAREMAHFNGFAYGQSWKESNLYTVNGETSDWMWQAHGIFAMSPEVGPEFNVSDIPGFWPPTNDVPRLSIDLHYSNLYAARISGPVYVLHVKQAVLDPATDGGSTVPIISVDVVLANRGLRSGTAEVLGSIFLNGTDSSAPISLHLAANPEGSGRTTEKKITLRIPFAETSTHELTNKSQELYLNVRDKFSCQLFRVAIHFQSTTGKRTQSTLQTWQALSLPRCGTCEWFGREGEGVSYSPVCFDIGEVTKLRPIQTRTFSSRFVSEIMEDNTTSVFSNPATNDQQASIFSSIVPSSVSWSGPLAMASLVALVLLLLVVLVWKRRWRNGETLARTKSMLGTRKKRTNNVQYSRVHEDAATSPAAGQEEDDERHEMDLVEAEYGEKAVMSEEETGLVSTKQAKAPRRTFKSSEDMA